MVSGALSKGELQAWALNRYCYQAVIPARTR
jgi:pyrroloquinoline-quinone synthase